MVHPMSDMEILEVHRRTAFTFDAQRRMIHESAPNESPGRRFSFTGCRDGNLAVVRADVPGSVARELLRLVASEPPLASPTSEAVHLDAYRELLQAEPVSVDKCHGLLWVFPSSLKAQDPTELVWSGTSDGNRLLHGLQGAMPQSLVDAGFRTQEDLWEPWCIATVDGQIASIAETARRGPAGSEVGVDTADQHRGKGLGAAATAGWSRHPDVAAGMRFYSTGRENASSRRLTERLGLRFLGSTCAIE